jgi:tetratricopeptide (TPR) repeat protein
MAERRTLRNPRANEAFDLLKQGRDAEAREILEDIVARDEADAAVLETLGDVREKLGDKAGAMDAYAGAVTHLRARGEAGRAMGVLELMMLVDDTSAEPHVEAAEIRLEQGDAEACWRSLSTACELLIQGGLIVRAVELCRSYADVLPDAAPALRVARRMEFVDKKACARLCADLGHALRKRHKNDEALALYAFALDLQPSFREVLHARAGALLDTGRVAEARVVVERALALNPQDLIGIGLLERCAAAIGDEAGIRAARERFDRVSWKLEKDPERGDKTSEAAPTSSAEGWTDDTAEHTAEHAQGQRVDTDEDPTDLER